MTDNPEHLTFKYNKGTCKVYPNDSQVSNWEFEEDQQDEAMLCKYVAQVGLKNGVSTTELHSLFPAILRILKSDIEWAEQKKP